MTLYVVQAEGGDDDALVRARFTPDAFSWPAFVYGQLWLIYRRLWLALLVWIVLEIAYVLFVYPHVAIGVSMAVDALAHLFLGFEGNRLRQTKLAKSAVVTDVVVARTRDEAEVVFYSRQGSTEARA